MDGDAHFLNRISAQLTEEWTIRPNSTLPSVWETIAIQQTETALNDAIHTAVVAFIRFLLRVNARLQALVERHQWTPWISSSNSSSTTIPTSSSIVPHSSETLPGDTNFLRVHGRRVSRLLGKVVRLAQTAVVLAWTRTGTAICVACVRFVIERVRLGLSSPYSSSVSEALFGTVRLRGTSPNETDSLSPLTRTDQFNLALVLAMEPLCRDFYQSPTIRPQPQPQPQVLVLRNRSMWTLFRVLVWPKVLLAVRAGLLSGNIWCQWRYLLGKSQFSDLRNQLLQQTVVRRHRFPSLSMAATEPTISIASPNGGKRTPETISNGTETTNSAATSTNDTTHGAGAAFSVSLSQHSSWILTAALTATVAWSWLTQARFWYMERYRQQLQQRQEPQQEPRQHHHQHHEQMSRSSSQQLVGERESMRQTPGLAATERSCIPVPLLPDASNSQLALKLPLGSCPLCSCRPWRQPTACSRTGLVFCHVCIVKHVRQFGTCPVTGTPVTESQLVRIYEPISTPQKFESSVVEASV